ncbi:hypothetical protein GGF32_009722 [Allomyces javanicus]|nr:hypothetical protein GGF32_009722 [Allomyces javanicus]
MFRGADKARFSALQLANATLSFADRFEFYLALCKRTVPHDEFNVKLMLPEWRAFYHTTDWGCFSETAGDFSSLLCYSKQRSRFSLDDMATTVSPDEQEFTDLWTHWPSMTEARAQTDGKCVTETFYERFMLVAVSTVNEIEFTRKYLGPDEAMDVFAAMFDRPGFTDDSDWVLNSARSLSKCKKRDLTWGRTLLLRVMREGHAAGVMLILDQWPVLPLLADDALLRDLITSVVWPQVAADLMTRFRPTPHPPPPAEYPNDPEIDAFLRSDSLRTTITGQFHEIDDAQAFLDRHRGSPHFLVDAGVLITGVVVFLRRRNPGVRAKAVKRGLVAEEWMRKLVDFFGDGVAAAGMGEGDAMEVVVTAALPASADASVPHG